MRFLVFTGLVFAAAGCLRDPLPPPDAGPDMPLLEDAGTDDQGGSNPDAAHPLTLALADPETLATGEGPVQAVALGLLADVNGPTAIDIVTANLNSNSVTILPGYGDGSFGVPIHFQAGLAPVAVAIADLSGDSKPDLVVASGADATVSVLLNEGDYEFAEAQAYGTGGSGLSAIALGDVDGSGAIDVVAGDTSTGDLTMAVLLGDGVGGFLDDPARYAAGPRPSSLVLASLDGDATLDVATTNLLINQVNTLINDGSGVFGAPTPIGVASHPTSMVAADFNQDGLTDLAYAATDAGSVGVLLGTGENTFADPVTYAIESVPRALATGDMDLDGYVDLVVTCGVPTSIAVLRGKTDGTFFEPQVFAIDMFAVWTSLAVADVNGDGLLDVVTGHNEQNAVSLILNVSY